MKELGSMICSVNVTVTLSQDGRPYYCDLCLGGHYDVEQLAKFGAQRYSNSNPDDCYYFFQRYDDIEWSDLLCGKRTETRGTIFVFKNLIRKKKTQVDIAQAGA